MGTDNRPSSPADLRKSVRYALHVPVSFKWVDERGVRQEGRGQSRDISASGAFVFALPCPPAGATVSLNILLSPDRQTAPPLEIQADARVLRIEQAGQGKETSGFAVTNQKTIVLRGSEVIDEWTPPMAGQKRRNSVGAAPEGRDGDEKTKPREQNGYENN